MEGQFGEMRLGARVDVETENGNWETVKTCGTYEEAEREVSEHEKAGKNAMVSCACGSYEYGECALCNIDARDANSKGDNLKC